MTLLWGGGLEFVRACCTHITKWLTVWLDVDALLAILIFG